MKNYDLIKITDYAYIPPKKEDPNNGYIDANQEGWEYVGSSDDLGLSKEGYFGVAFKKGEEVVVAHRGTDGITDVDDDISIWFNKIPDQYEYALKFTQTIQSQFKDKSITVVGHSKGAAHAELTGIATNLPVFSVESPGARNVAAKLFPLEQIESHKSKIVSFVSSPNLVNTAGKHIVMPTQVVFESPLDGVNKYHYSKYTLHQHGIQNIIENFDQQTGMPKNSLNPKDWPLGLEAGSDIFVSKVLANSPKEHVISSNYKSPEEVAKKYGIDVSRIENYEYEFALDEQAKNDFSLKNSYKIAPQFTNPKNTGHHSFVSNSHENVCGSLYCSTSEKKNWFDPYKLTGSFQSINKQNMPSDYFKNPVLDSFISGKYISFNSLQGNLFTPFTDWRGNYVPSQDVMEKLKSLKIMGFMNTYNPFTQKEYVSGFDQFKQKYQPKEEPFNFAYYNMQKDFISRPFKLDYSWQVVKSQPTPAFTNSWTQSYIPHGRAAQYTAPNGGFTIQVGFARPVAIDLKDDGIKFINLNESSTFFDVNDDEYLENVSWVDKEDGILFYDQNDDNIITEAKEVILTKLDTTAKTDFDVLKNKFDINKDNILDNKDDEFSKLKIWQDLNQNGVAEVNEISSLAEKGIISISLNFTLPEEKFAQENHIANLAKASFANGNSTTIYDWAMAHSSYGVTFNQEDSTISINFQNGEQESLFDANKEEALIMDVEDSNFDAIIATSHDDKITIAKHKGALIDTGDGDDEVTLQSGNNWVKGGAGKDTIKTGAGHDILFIDKDDEIVDSGEGFDVAFISDSRGANLNLNKSNLEAVYGNAGDDLFDGSGVKAVILHGNAGNDTLIGSDADDIITGGLGKDTIKAGKGNDFIFFDNQDVTSEIDAGEGEDTVIIEGQDSVTLDLDSINAEIAFGNIGNDKFSALGNKNYILYGDKGNDELIGGKGKTVLDGGLGNDILRGGTGNNLYIFSEKSGNDTILSHGKNRGEMKDFVLLSSSIKLEDLSFSKSQNDLLMIHKNGESSLRVVNWFLGDQYKVNGFIYSADDKEKSQSIILHEGAEELNLNNQKNWIVYCLNAKSYLLGSEGSEFVRFSDGDDFFFSRGGKDIVFGGKGNDILNAWLDPLVSGDGLNFHGEDGDDTLLGSNGADVLDGGLGCDVSVGEGGDDIIYTGGGEVDNLRECDYVDGGIGNDIIYLQGSGAKSIRGGAGNDTFVIEPGDYKDHTIYTILDFEFNNTAERIDFSKIANIRSLSDFPPKEVKVAIDLSITKKSIDKILAQSVNQKAEIVDAEGLCWKGELPDSLHHCIYLPRFTKSMLVDADKNGQFLYYES